jgi:hypothetical protein
MPVPIVHQGEIIYSLEGPKIYFNILIQIIKMEKKIKFDDPDFLKLIMDNIQIFERHWRKMVADIRTAKLSKQLDISSEKRKSFETTNLPRPRLASELDYTFRQLGFHKKVLGKDIQIRPYAELKDTTTKIKRKNSLPNISSGLNSGS